MGLKIYPAQLQAFAPGWARAGEQMGTGLAAALGMPTPEQQGLAMQREVLQLKRDSFQFNIEQAKAALDIQKQQLGLQKQRVDIARAQEEREAKMFERFPGYGGSTGQQGDTPAMMPGGAELPNIGDVLPWEPSSGKIHKPGEPGTLVTASVRRAMEEARTAMSTDQRLVYQKAFTRANQIESNIEDIQQDFAGMAEIEQIKQTASAQNLDATSLINAYMQNRIAGGQKVTTIRTATIAVARLAQLASEVDAWQSNLADMHFQRYGANVPEDVKREVIETYRRMRTNLMLYANLISEVYTDERLAGEGMRFSSGADTLFSTIGDTVAAMESGAPRYNSRLSALSRR